MKPATSTVEERQGSKCVCVRLGEPLRPEDERWMCEVLHGRGALSLGVAFTEFHAETHRLVGYGIWEPWYDNFCFWLGVAIYQSLEGDEDGN